MSKPRFFRKTLGGDEDSRSLQTNIEQAIAGFIKSPLLDGLQLDDVSLATGNTKIKHKLGRKIRGYLIVKRSNASTIYDSASDDLFLTLNASAPLTVSLWIF